MSDEEKALSRRRASPGPRAEVANDEGAGTSGRVAYSTAEAAKKLGTSEATIWRWIRAGTLQSIKIGGRRLVSARQIDGLFDTAA